MASSEIFEALVERAFSGDGDAFDELYRLLHRYLRNFMGSYHAAEDVAQETLQKVWLDWKNDKRHPSKLRSWIFRVAHNTAVDHMRKNLCPTISLDDLGDPDISPVRDYLCISCPEEIPEKYVLLLEDRQLIRWVLSRVSEIQRSCFVLFVIEKVKLREIAQIHQCSERTVQRYIEGARKEFQQICERLIVEQRILERSSDR
jgi:RNA polymerase sigma factor (sigma-70 family)